MFLNFFLPRKRLSSNTNYFTVYEKTQKKHVIGRQSDDELLIDHAYIYNGKNASNDIDIQINNLNVNIKIIF